MVARAARIAVGVAGQMKGKLRKLGRRAQAEFLGLKRVPARWVDGPISFATVLAFVGAIAWVMASRAYDSWDDEWQGLFVEASGAVMDLVVFGVVIAVVMLRRDRKREVRSQQELIDDFKKWDSDEARYRIAGAVRRLNRVGKTSVDFVGLEMSGFSFRRHDIRSIAGSTFYAGEWESLGSRENALLREVDYSVVDCSGVVFSAGHPFGGLGFELPRQAQFNDCRFEEADLRGATFKGALLAWTEEPPEETGYAEETPEGDASGYRSTAGRFTTRTSPGRRSTRWHSGTPTSGGP